VTCNVAFAEQVLCSSKEFVRRLPVWQRLQAVQPPTNGRMGFPEAETELFGWIEEICSRTIQRSIALDTDR